MITTHARAIGTYRAYESSFNDWAEAERVMGIRFEETPHIFLDVIVEYEPAAAEDGMRDIICVAVQWGEIDVTGLLDQRAYEEAIQEAIECHEAFGSGRGGR